MLKNGFLEVVRLGSKTRPETVRRLLTRAARPDRREESNETQFEGLAARPRRGEERAAIERALLASSGLPARPSMVGVVSIIFDGVWGKRSIQLLWFNELLWFNDEGAEGGVAGAKAEEGLEPKREGGIPCWGGGPRSCYLWETLKPANCPCTKFILKNFIAGFVATLISTRRNLLLKTI